MKQEPNREKSRQPGPYTETEGFRVSSGRIILGVWATATVFGYTLPYVLDFSTTESVNNLGVLGDLVAKRLEYLSQGGPLSQSSFVAIIWCNLFLVPLGIAANAVGYWIKVVSRKQCRPESVQNIKLFTRHLAMIGFFNWICFAFAPRDFSGPLDKAAVLFWPYFPPMAAVFTMLNVIVGFSLLVTLLKYAFLRDGHSERVEQQP